MGAAVAASAVHPILERRDSGRQATGPREEIGPAGLDESAEAAFLGEARDHGEPVPPPKPAASATEVEESDPKPLPSLETLVQQIPAEVRDVLDDLFRAKFVRVQRVPRQALKT